MLDTVKKAKPGSIVTFSSEYEALDPVEYFAKISNYGKKKHSLLVQTEDMSIGTADPALYLTGKGEEFEITALSDTGKRFLNFIKKNFSFATGAKFQKDTIKGKIVNPRKNTSEDQKLKLKSHLDVIRTVAFAFKQVTDSAPYAGVYGSTSYDLIDHFEDLPENKQNSDDLYYELYFVDNGFAIHKDSASYFFASALITDKKAEAAYEEGQKKLKSYQKTVDKKLPKLKKGAKKNASIEYDTSDEEFESIIREIKKQIVAGTVIQANPSRLITSNFNAEPLDIYSSLASSNGSYTFFVNNGERISIGGQSTLHISVNADHEVSFSTISTTRPRGIDTDSDSKREVRIWADEHELVKHLINLDAARNTVSRVSKAGTTTVDEMFVIKKQEHAQYLLSTVTGKLKDNLDSLHVLQTTIGHDAGIPIASAAKLLRKLEKTGRGMYSGSFILLGVNGDLQTLLLEPLTIQKDKLTFRTSSFILHNGVNDLQKSQSEEDMIKSVVKKAGGIK